MTLRQKIGQTMIMLPDRRLELKLGHGSLEDFFARYPVSGFFLGWKLFAGVAEEAKLAHLRARVLEYQKASLLPLIFQQDYEAGVPLPGMTSFPAEMALGAANSKNLAHDYGKAIALEARSVGVQWVLHPVADLNLNPLNPIVNVRCVSDNAETAIRLLKEQIRGLQEGGVAATIKHFPGDGVDYRDHHLLTSCNSLSRREWARHFGKVFQALIDAGVDAVMPGHISLPAYQKERLNGFPLPASLSRELMTNLLKGRMGFQGVIVSDALTMGGFRGWYQNELESEIQSFAAGTDVMLWPSYGYMDELERRITLGEIPLARLDDAVSRVWALKARLGILRRQRPLLRTLTSRERGFAASTAEKVCEGAVTLVRDRRQALPLRLDRDRRLLLVGIAPSGRKAGKSSLEKLGHLKSLLEARGFRVDYEHNLLYEDLGWRESATATYDRIIFVVVRSPHSPIGPLGLYAEEAQSAWAVNAMPKDKVVVISLGSPYFGNEYFERSDVYINAYSNVCPMHEAVVRTLMGEIPFKGKSPVDLGASFPP